MAHAREPMSRRRWLAAGAALAGYALAASPTLAQAVRTDEAGLAVGQFEVTVGDAVVPVYEARPAEAAAAPIVLLVPEIWGLHEYIRDCARRFAKAGYCAVAPELFARAGGVTQIPDTQTLLMIVNNQKRETLLGDLRAAMEWARRRPGVSADRVGINGWCWGGALTLQAAARLPGVRAAVAWYGAPTRPFPGESGPATGFDVAKDVRVPFLSLSGALDKSPSPEDMKKFVDLARAAGNPNAEMFVYPNAGHAFHADYRPSYAPAAAAAAWERCLQFFARHLRA
jgi:carboxymethylenebutenolidase